MPAPAGRSERRTWGILSTLPAPPSSHAGRVPASPARDTTGIQCRRAPLPASDDPARTPRRPVDADSSAARRIRRDRGILRSPSGAGVGSARPDGRNVVDGFARRRRRRRRVHGLPRPSDHFVDGSLRRLSHGLPASGSSPGSGRAATAPLPPAPRRRPGPPDASLASSDPASRRVPKRRRSAGGRRS